MKKFLLSMLGVLIALPGIARDFTYEYEGQTLTYTVIDEDAKTCKTKNGTKSFPVEPGNSVSGALEIPSIAKDGDVEYTVIEIGDLAFPRCNGLTSVIIPASVSSIGNEAFKYCDDLKTFIVKDGGDPIAFKNDAFYGSSVEHLYIGRNWSNSSKVAISTGITSVEIGNSVTQLPNYAFKSCTRLTSVTIPNSVKSIGVEAFCYCLELTSVTIPNSVTKIGREAFMQCDNLESFIVEDGSASIAFGENALSYLPIKHLYIGRNWSNPSGEAITTSITSVEIGNSVTELPEYAFKGCHSLKSVTIPTSVKSIGNSAFRYCTDLTSVTIPNSVTKIGHSAFSQCSGLTSVIIPPSVTSIATDAFENCTALKKAAYPSELYNPFSSGIISIKYPREVAIIEDGFVYGSEKKALYFVPLSLEGEYVIPESVNEIGNNAFFYCAGLTSVTIPNSVSSIGNKAFSECSGLTSMTIPNSVKSIGYDAFTTCSGLKTFIVEDGRDLIAFEENAISKAPIEHLYIGRNWSSNFYQKTITTSITSVEIGNSVTALPNDAFKGCSGLKSVTIPNSVTYIASGAFKECYGLTSVTIPNSVTEIGSSAFSGCSGLTSVTIGNSVAKIGSYAFECTALRGIILPPSVKTIDYSAFADNRDMTSIIMSHNVTYIGDKAFYNSLVDYVYITAQSLPVVCSNTFNYIGTLYVQGQEAADAYAKSDPWYRFSGPHLMIEPTEMKVEGNKTLNGKPGDTFQLKATLYPENVTLPQVFWRSTNPEIATVDANGLVTLHADMSEVMAMAEGDDDTTGRSCKIVAESLYANGPVAEFTINDVTTGIEDVTADSGNESGDIDFSAPVEIYNLQGVRVSDSVENLANGIYIIRQGNNVTKIVVK